MKPEKEIKKWWEETSENYQEQSAIHTKSAHYGPYAPDEDKLKLLGNVKGKKILELGCGGGQCSIAFAKQGARVTGIDLSEEQLKYARKLAEKENINVNFVHGSFQDLKKIKTSDYDIVFSAFAFQYSPDLNKLFRQINRVLKEKGIFVFSFDHPFYSIINPETHKISRKYETGKFTEEEVWRDGTKHKFVGFSNKIGDIYSALIESGFIVEKIIEPVDLKQNKAWTKDFWNGVYPKKLVKLVPPTIIFKMRKK